MNATTLHGRIGRHIADIWNTLEEKEAHLSVAQLRELENQVREIFFEAKREVCKHEHTSQSGCFDCGLTWQKVAEGGM